MVGLCRNARCCPLGLRMGGLPDVLWVQHATAAVLRASQRSLLCTIPCACRPMSEAGKRTPQEHQQEQAEPLLALLAATPVPSSHRSAASSGSVLDASVDELAAAVERMGPDR